MAKFRLSLSSQMYYFLSFLKFLFEFDVSSLYQLIMTTKEKCIFFPDIWNCPLNQLQQNSNIYILQSFT